MTKTFQQGSVGTVKINYDENKSIVVVKSFESHYYPAFLTEAKFAYNYAECLSDFCVKYLKIDERATSLTMKYYEHGDLFDWYIDNYHTKKIQCPDDVILDIAKQLFNMISAYNVQGLMHGDIKPENILITGFHDVPSGKCPNIVFCDHGCTTQFHLETGMSININHNHCGTACYNPPELVIGNSKPILHKSSDIWSAGVTLYVLIAGTNPFNRTDIQTTYTCIKNYKMYVRSNLPVNRLHYYDLLALMINDMDKRGSIKQILKVIDAI